MVLRFLKCFHLFIVNVQKSVDFCEVTLYFYNYNKFIF